ncbi:hypothetical protein [Jannaschia sp. W003]|uniref:hypothetical protein n=1 Tax=Jannaschia sp. W003 TaxID=2867012 RepID=UPI0021A4ACCB|nr:hypothetical protein [Jannaschia sp. W003]UWQ23087.1 hypothetical protein K3554_06910 [Jannaschia sp. W003]
MPIPFLRCESGAVSIDWVVLSAAVAGLGIAVVTVVSVGAETRSNAFVTQTEVWRKGEHAKEAYAAHQQDGFMAMYEVAATLEDVDLATVNGYANSYRGTEDYEAWDEATRNMFDDFDASIAAHYAEMRAVRSSETTYEQERFDRLYRDEYHPIAQSYQGDGQTYAY